MNRITNLREIFLTDKLLLIRKSKIIYISLNHNIQNSIDDLERIQSLEAKTKLKIKKKYSKRAFGKDGKKIQKDELELANKDSWAKTAECIAKTMPEALKIMRYLPTKPEAKFGSGRYHNL